MDRFCIESFLNKRKEIGLVGLMGLFGCDGCSVVW